MNGSSMGERIRLPFERTARFSNLMIFSCRTRGMPLHDESIWIPELGGGAASSSTTGLLRS